VAAGPNSIHAFFILLHLLERQSELFTQLFLAHAKQHASKTDAGTDVNINRIWFS
jgi:hypothetical protein